MASSYLLLPFVPSAFFYREYHLLYPLHLTFYFKDSLDAIPKVVIGGKIKSQRIRVKIYCFLMYKVLCQVMLLLPVAILFIHIYTHIT